MMKCTGYYWSVVLLSWLLIGCGGAQKEEVVPEPTEESMTATINGSNWKAQVVDMLLLDNDFLLSGQELDANGFPTRVIVIQGPFTRPGTYGIGAVNGNEVGYIEEAESADISRGALVITRITDRWVEGTFNFEGSIGRGANNRRIVVTNGRFAAKKR
ncbi:MAG: DUF6252 family protein [Cytophagales bacterium]|nr:DUF6252 family protein [Bernardetiaceae bacterium]MDW8204071.1 DUF6252 family protein [Cytophagales bacterium]